MNDFNPNSESPPDPPPPNSRWDGWRGKAQTVRTLRFVAARGFATIPDDDYGAEDLDGGGFQTLFGSDNGKKTR
jgi:hypothetical protein